MEKSIVVLGPKRSGGNVTTCMLSKYGSGAYLEHIAGSYLYSQQAKIVENTNLKNRLNDVAVKSREQLLDAEFPVMKEFPAWANTKEPLLQHSIEQSAAIVFVYRNPLIQARSFIDAFRKDVITTLTTAEHESNLTVDEILWKQVKLTDLEWDNLREDFEMCHDLYSSSRPVLLINFDDLGKDPVTHLSVIHHSLPEDVRNKLSNDNIQDLLSWDNERVSTPLVRAAMMEKVMSSQNFKYKGFTSLPNISDFPSDWQSYIQGKAMDEFRMLENDPRNMKYTLAQQKLMESHTKDS